MLTLEYQLENIYFHAGNNEKSMEIFLLVFRYYSSENRFAASALKNRLDVVVFYDKWLAKLVITWRKFAARVIPVIPSGI